MGEIPPIKLTDYIGIQAVYEAFQESKVKYEKKPTDIKLIKLNNFNVEQLFFLSFANVSHNILRYL